MLLKEAKKEGLDQSEDVKKKVESFSNQIIKNALISNIAKSSVSEEKIKARYEILSKELKGKTEYKAKHILLGSKEDANKIVRRLKKEAFDKLAKAESIDKSTSESGGDLGYLISGGMYKEFEDVLSKLKVGKISAPVKTQSGWHIIKLEGKKDAIALPYDKVKGAIAQDISTKAIRSYIDTLLEGSKIKLTSEG